MATTAKYSQKEFIKAAKNIHGNRYSYSKVIYTRLYERIILVCRKHGDFELLAKHHLHKKLGCRLCAKEAEIISRARKIHGNIYSYSKVIYKGYTTNITITCPKHGDFQQTPNVHLGTCNSGCQQCGIEKSTRTGPRQTTADYVNKVTQKYKGKYSYNQLVYTGIHNVVTVTCREHGPFTVSAKVHMFGKGNRGHCPKCKAKKTTGYSSLALLWIESERKRRNIRNIRTAANGGEFYLPGTKYKVDGYHERSNTVFEFHGDCFHGNLNRYRPRDRPNPYSTKTAKFLYLKTLARDQEIRDLGYNLVVMWEKDFREYLESLN